MRLVLAFLLGLGTVISAHAQGFAPTSSVSGGGGSSSGCDPSALSDGAVLFVGSGLCAGAANFSFSVNGGNLPVLSIGDVGTSDKTDGIGLALGVNESDGNTPIVLLRGTGSTGYGEVLFRRSNGTIGTPTDVTAGLVLGRMHSAGYTSSGFIDQVNVQFEIDTTYTGGALAPGVLKIFTSPDGGNALERLRIDSAGRNRFGDSLSNTTFPSGSRENTAVISGRADGTTGTDLSYVTLSAVEDFYSLVFNAAEGTFAAPTAFSGGVLGAINFQGYNGGSYSADVSLIAATDGSYSSAFPTKFTITTHNDAGTARTWTLDSAGVAVNSGALMLGSATKLTLTATELGMAHSIAASGSAPGAGGGKSAFICGSTSGTLKWILYGGTSTTYTVMADNLGGSATSC